MFLHGTPQMFSQKSSIIISKVVHVICNGWMGENTVEYCKQKVTEVVYLVKMALNVPSVYPVTLKVAVCYISIQVIG